MPPTIRLGTGSGTTTNDPDLAVLTKELAAQHARILAEDPDFVSLYDLEDLLRHVMWAQTPSDVSPLPVRISSTEGEWSAIVGVSKITVDNDENSVTLVLADPLPRQDDEAISAVERGDNKSPFVVIPAQTSKGPEWWAGFEGYRPVSVSEISPTDARASAAAFLARHGWRPEMGAEAGMLLIACYERGRMDQQVADKPFLGDDDYVMLTNESSPPVRAELDDL